jgi:hypothetical protein
MLDKDTAKVVAECVAKINPELVKGSGALFTQQGLESLLQVNESVVMKTVTHIAQHCMLNEDAIKSMRSIIKEEA